MDPKQYPNAFTKGNVTDGPAATEGQPDGEKVPDGEFFIRQAFRDNPLTGYELLFRQYYRPLCSHAARYVYTKEIAEDLVSDVFYLFWKNQTYLKIHISFRAYLFASIRHRSLNYLRWEFFKENNDELEAGAHFCSTPGPDQILEYDELNLHIQKTVNDLPPQCRKVFLMNRFEGRSYPEIAKLTGVSLKAVEGHISKALARFRKTLRGYRDS